MTKTLKTLADVQATFALYEYFRVTLAVDDKLLGGIPKSPDVIENWISFRLDDTHRLHQLAARTASAIGLNKPDPATAVAEHQAAMGATTLTDEQIEEIKQYNWSGFHRDEHGLYLEGRCIKALFKEAANVLKNRLGMTALKARIAERLFVVEHTIPLGVTAPTGDLESVVHAMTPQGPINALTRSEYVLQPTLCFTVKTLTEPLITKDKKHALAPRALVELLLDYGTNLGLGAGRSQGHGRFQVVSIEAMDARPEEKAA